MARTIKEKGNCSIIESDGLYYVRERYRVRKVFERPDRAERYFDELTKKSGSPAVKREADRG